MNRSQLEAGLAELPLVQYAFFSTEELTFSPKIRQICEENCPRYGRTWACPPGVGTVEACRERCLAYPRGLLLSTVAEGVRPEDLEACLAARGPHEAVTHQAIRLLADQGLEVYALSTESCALCEACTYPHAPCRHPEKMLPCVESHGILLTALAERYAMEYRCDHTGIYWFSLLLFRNP